MIARIDYTALTDEELTFQAGDRFHLLDDEDAEWLFVRVIMDDNDADINPIVEEGYAPSACMHAYRSYQVTNELSVPVRRQSNLYGLAIDQSTNAVLRNSQQADTSLPDGFAPSILGNARRESITSNYPHSRYSLETKH